MADSGSSEVGGFLSSSSSLLSALPYSRTSAHCHVTTQCSESSRTSRTTAGYVLPLRGSSAPTWSPTRGSRASPSPALPWLGEAASPSGPADNGPGEAQTPPQFEDVADGPGAVRLHFEGEWLADSLPPPSPARERFRAATARASRT